MDTLECRQLTEEPQTIAGPILCALDCSWLGESAPVLFKKNALDRQPPIDVALSQEMAGGDEKIDQAQHRLRKSLAHEERLW